MPSEGYSKYCSESARCSCAPRVYSCTFLFPGVYLSLNGEIIANHGYVAISDIGSSDNTALLCITSRPPPSGSTSSGGNWFAPDGTIVGSLGTTAGFGRNRGPMVVRLRRNTATDPAAEGIYHCEVLDNTETEQRVYVGLYNGGGMYWFTECSWCN